MITLVVVTVGFIFYNFIVPTIAKNVAIGILEDLGFTNVDLEVHSVSSTGIYASNLREGSDQFQIGGIGVNYNVGDLLSGEIDTITLVGVEWEMLIRDGQITIAPFDALPPSDPNAPAGTLPFKTLRLQSSNVGIDWDGYKLRVPVNATVTNVGTNHFDIAMNLDVLGSPIKIEGSVQPDANAKESEQLIVAADLDYLKTPWKIGGKLNLDNGAVDIDVELADSQAGPSDESLSVQMSFHQFDDGHTVELEIWTRQKQVQWNFLGDAMEATDVEARFQIGIDERLRITELAAHFESPAVSWNEFALTNFVCWIDQREGRMDGLAQATGDGWTANLKSDAPSIGKWLADEADYSINGSWQLDGKMPRWIADQVSRFGFKIDQKTDASFTGAVRVDLQANTNAHADSIVAGSSTDGPVKQPWRIVSNDITLDLGRIDLQSADKRVQLTDLAGTLKLSAEVTPATLTWRLLSDSNLQFAKATMGGPSPISIAKNSIKFAPGENAPDADSDDDSNTGTFNHLIIDQSTDRWQGKLFARSGSTLQVTSQDFSANLNQLRVTGKIGGDSKRTPHAKENPATKTPPIPIALQVAFKDSEVRSDAFDVAIKGMEASLPIQFGGKLTNEGSYSFADIRYRGKALPRIDGTASYADGQVQLGATWQLFENAAMDATASIDLTPNYPHGKATFETPKFAWAEADRELLNSLVPEIGDMKIEGSLAIDGGIDFARGRLVPKIRLDTHDVTLESSQFDIAAKGITGSVTINNFTPLATPGQQKLQIRELKIGKVDFKNGVIAFRVESPESIFIERTTWAWGDKGQFYLHAFRFEPNLDEYDVELFVENLDLNDWIDTLTDKHVDGTGLLYGRLPVIVRPKAKEKVTIGSGFLYAQPKAGGLEIRDTEMIRNILISSDPRFASDETMKEVLNQIVDAMKDFEYHRLAFDFIPRPEQNDLQLRISTAGKGRDRNGKKGVPIENLTVNLNGIDKLINESLFWKRGSENAVQNALEDFFKP